MFGEKNPFSFSFGGCFAPVKPSGTSLLQSQPSNDMIKAPHEKPQNTGSKLLKAMTSDIISVFTKITPKFHYDPVSNPKRCLTAPSEGVLNNGYDNLNNEYILYVNDVIKSPENEEYLILELLGKGTFGQVVRCSHKETKAIYAVKVIKNKPAYTNQALTEVKIFRKLKDDHPNNEEHIVKLHDYFVFRNHICIIFELMHFSLYDLLRLSNFAGFSLKFIGNLAQQIIEGIICLERSKIIHCDLKPENVLFLDDESDKIKLIDLGSSCFIHKTVYTYIQSRHYRAPEVVLGAKYNNKIDSWSLGCMVAEFYFGLPIFPGNSEYDLLKRMIDIKGIPDDETIENGRFKNKFFRKEEGVYILKPLEEFEKEQNTKLPPHKKFFILKRLDDLEIYYNKSKQREKQPQEKPRFEIFLHFLKGLLEWNPSKRWTSSQAFFHPFLTGEPFDPNWEPLPHQEALAAYDKKLKEQQNDQSIPKPTITINKEPTQAFNGESYRPPIPVDKREEAASQSQNVYLLNSQTNSNKPKSKLNPNASYFGGNPFQVPPLDIQTQNLSSQPPKSGSHSEPNSGRNSKTKQTKNNFSGVSYQEEKDEGVEGQAEGGRGQGNNNNKKRSSSKNDQYYQQAGNYTGYNNAPQMGQYYPQGGQQNYGQYQGGNNPRQRSNSDQGASENIFFQNQQGNTNYQNQQGNMYYQNPQGNNYQNYNYQQQNYGNAPQNYNNQYQYQNQNYNNQYQNQSNQGYPSNQNRQGKKGSGNRGGRGGYNNKHGNKNYNPPSQYDEKEENMDK